MLKNIPLRRLIIIGFVFFSFVPVLVTGFFFYTQSLEQAREGYHHEMVASVGKVDSYVVNLFSNFRNLGVGFVGLEAVKKAGGEITSYIDLKANTPEGKVRMAPEMFAEKERKLFDIMKAFGDSFSSVKFLTLATENDGGILMVPPRDRSPGYDARKRSWYRSCAESAKKQIFSGLYISSNNELSIEILTKIQADGVLQGVFDISVDVSYVQELAEKSQIGNGHIIVVDRDDTVIAHTGDSSAIGKKMSELSGGYGHLHHSSSEKAAASDEHEHGHEHEHKDSFAEVRIKGVDYLGQHVKSKDADLGWTYHIFIEESGFNEIKRKILLNTSGIVLVLFIFVLGGTFFISSSVLKLTRSISSSLDRVAEGDFRVQLPAVRVRELNNIIQQFNSTITRLALLIKDVARSTSDVKESSESFAEISQDISRELAETSEKSGKVSHAAEAMNARIADVSSGISASSESVANIASAEEEMMGSINEIAKNSDNATQITQNAVNVVDETSTQINALKDSAVNIAKVVETIAEISAQTNLLALNATIEAARAGEAGKGFAVVANEIKELALQTNKATDDIKARIEGVQGATGKAVGGVERLSEVINSVNDIVKSIAGAVDGQSATTTEIAQNVSEVSTELHDANTNVSDISQTTSDIVNDIRMLNNATKDIAQSGEEILGRSQQLRELADKLKDIVDKFQI